MVQLKLDQYQPVVYIVQLLIHRDSFTRGEAVAKAAASVMEIYHIMNSDSVRGMTQQGGNSFYYQATWYHQNGLSQD